ncbi:MAG: carboxypeptidase-like regulatory domain-containing protein [Planctomycetota bacterium]|nr:carboxypeptidase-like regulatory domain-containing protein [Planctomycetota bacterium]
MVTLDILQDGKGTASVPLLSGGFFQATLVGAGVAPEVRRFESPGIGQVVKVAFEGHNGEVLPVRFVGKNGTGIEGVSVSSTWQESDGSFAVTSVLARTDSVGIAEVALPRASVSWIGQDHPGYQSGFVGPLEVDALPRTEDDSLLPYEVVLEPLVELTGRVRASGEDLLEYTLFGWPGGAAASEQEQLDYDIDPKGVFRLMVPDSPINLAAWAEGYGQSRSVWVDAGSAAEDQIVIDLPDALFGRGRVLDERTRKPVAGASIEVHITDFGVAYTRAPVELVTSEAGTFEALAFSPAETANITVVAEGYAKTGSVARFESDGTSNFVDFGDVLLAQDSWAEIEVVGLRLDEEAWIEIDSSGEWLQLQRRGELLIHRESGMHAGRFPFLVSNGSETYREQRVEYLTGRGPWTLRLEVHGGAGLEVNLGQLGSDCVGGFIRVYLGSAFETVERECILQAEHLEAGLVRIDGIQPGPAVLVLHEPVNGVAIAGASLEVLPGTHNQVSLKPCDRNLKVEVVDPAGQPIPGTVVGVGPAIAPGHYSYFGYADSSGVADLGPVPFESGVLRALRPDSALLAGVPIQVPENGDPIQVIFDVDHYVNLLVQDRGVPLAGVSMQTAIAAMDTAASMRFSDDQGNVLIGPVSDVEFECRPMASWVWTESRMVHAVEEGAEPVVIEFRRVGDLAFEVRDSGGMLLDGVAVEVLSEEYATDVAGWVAAGRVEAPSAGLVTDEEGRLLLSGLPNGAFAWSVPALGLEGKVVVPPLAEALVLVRPGS